MRLCCARSRAKCFNRSLDGGISRIDNRQIKILFERLPVGSKTGTSKNNITGPVMLPKIFARPAQQIESPIIGSPLIYGQANRSFASARIAHTQPFMIGMMPCNGSL